MSAKPAVLHISSLVVHARPEAAEAVERAILALEGTEVSAREGGKLVVLLETADEDSIVDTTNRISLLDDVYSAGLVYHETVEHAATGDGRPRGGTITGDRT